MYGDEIFSSDPPIPASKKAKIPPPIGNDTGET